MVKNSCKNIEKLIFRYVNQTRKKNNLCELKPDRGLIFLARKHSSLMAKKRKIWHGKNVFVAKNYVSSSIWEVLKFILYPLAIFFPPLWIIFYFGEKGVSGENVALMPKGRVKGFKKGIYTDKDIARALHITWMKSDGHRKNILNKDFKKIGIGVKRNGNKFYATELFYG